MGEGGRLREDFPPRSFYCFSYYIDFSFLATTCCTNIPFPTRSKELSHVSCLTPPRRINIPSPFMEAGEFEGGPLQQPPPLPLRYNESNRITGPGRPGQAGLEPTHWRNHPICVSRAPPARNTPSLSRHSEAKIFEFWLEEGKHRPFKTPDKAPSKTVLVGGALNPDPTPQQAGVFPIIFHSAA